jgi:hypothetical protein
MVIEATRQMILPIGPIRGRGRIDWSTEGTVSIRDNLVKCILILSGDDRYVCSHYYMSRDNKSGKKRDHLDKGQHKSRRSLSKIDSS